MPACPQCRDMLWDELYGLLDETESKSLAAHLAGCPDCQRALEQARVHQQWLARAARLDVDISRFEAPATAAVSAGLFPRLARRPHIGSQFFTYAATAAAILVFVGLPTTLHWRAGSVQLARHAEIQQEVEELLARRATVRLDEAREEAAATQATKAHFVRLQIEGPSGFRPDRPGAYQIQARDMEGKPAGNVKVQVVDAARKVLFEKSQSASAGSILVGLPPTLELAPRTAARLEVSTSGDSETVPVVTPIRISPAYISHLTCDRQAYAPGDRFFFGARVVDRFDLHVCDRVLSLIFTIKDAKNSDVVKLRGSTNEAGIAGGVWDLPETLPDGDYTLEVAESQTRFASVARSFTVRKSKGSRLDPAGTSQPSLASAPGASGTGAVVIVPKRVLEPGDGIKVALGSTTPGQQFLVRLVCRGQLGAQDRITTGQGENSLVLNPGAGRSGLMHLTLYRESRELTERLADRLVYVRPKEWLKVAVEPDRVRYQPGEKVRLNLHSFNEQGQTESSWLQVSVVEQQDPASGLKKPPASLHAHCYLISELEPPVDLVDADALVAETASAQAALEQFLKTHDSDGASAGPDHSDRTPATDLVRLDNSAQVEPRYRHALASALVALRDRAEADMQSLTSQGESRLGEIRQGWQKLERQRNLYVAGLVCLLVLSGVGLVISATVRASSILAQFRLQLAGACAMVFVFGLVAPAAIERVGSSAQNRNEPAVDRLQAQLQDIEHLPALARSDAPATSAKPFIGVIPSQAGKVMPLPENVVRSSGPTLVWAPAVLARNGATQITFDLPAKPAAYRIRVEAHSPSGRLGVQESVVESSP